MASSYNPPRSRNLFDPKSKNAYTLSRGRIENFLKCPRCFYLDRRLGIDSPPLPGFSLNDAVDTLIKKEFDALRENGERHRLMEKYGIDAVPFKHNDLKIWRDDIRNYLGASYLHKPTNILAAGIIDDIWQSKNGRLHIVDYKATSSAKEISLEDEYKQSYKKQVEFYQWIFRQNRFEIDDLAYFVFANALKTPDKFDGKLEFDLQIIAHEGDDSWVEPTIVAAHKCLMSEKIPSFSPNCEYCRYRQAAEQIECDPKNEVIKNSKDSVSFNEGKLF